jgi:hypothetical protein
MSDYLGSAEVVGTRSELRAPDAERASPYLQRLEAVGLAASGLHGAYGLDRVSGVESILQGYERRDHHDPVTLIYSTANPKVFLGFRGGRLTTVLRETEPTFFTRNLPGYATKSILARHLQLLTNKDKIGALKRILVALEQEAPLAEERLALAKAPREYVIGREKRIWQRVAASVRSWDERFAKASALQQFELLRTQLQILARAKDETGLLITKAEAWRAASWKRVRERLRPVLSDKTGNGSEFITRLQVREALEQAWQQGLERGGKAKWERAISRLRWELPLHALVSADPIQTAIRQLVALQRWSKQKGGPDARFKDNEQICDRLSLRLRTWAAQQQAAQQLDAWELMWSRAMARSLDYGTRHNLAGLEQKMRAFAGLRAMHRAGKPRSLDAELAMASRLGEPLAGFSSRWMLGRTKGQPEPLAPLFERSKLWAQLAQNPADRALATALSAQLDPKSGAEGSEIARALGRVVSLRAAARRLALRGTREQQLTTLRNFANQQSRYGRLAGAVASELSIELGRAMDREARALAKRGEYANAARLWLSAATVGDTSAPEPRSAYQVRSLARVLAKKPTQGEGSRELRVRWLNYSRLHALAAITEVLPPLDAAAPAYPLQTRYLGRQLAGRGRYADWLGLRLSGQRDVSFLSRQQRSGTKGSSSERVRLFKIDGQPRWRPASSTASALDFAEYRIDSKGWSELRRRKSELDQAQSDLTAARRANSSSLPELNREKAELLVEIRGVTASVKSGKLDSQSGRSRLESLKRESNALQSAMSNYNDRVRHVNRMVNAYNEKVAVFNELLERLLKEMDIAFRKLLIPATSEWVVARLAESKLSQREKKLRLALLGLGGTEIWGEHPPAHPQSLRHVVSDLTDPAAAADRLARELESRLADKLFSSGLTAQQHIERMQPGFERYAMQYGADAFVRQLLQRALRLRAALHDLIVAQVSEAKRRAEVNKLRNK